MGCNSHMYIEYKSKTSIRHEYSCFFHNRIDSRNYDLYAKMAGVRNYDNIEPIDTPRGLPSDIGHYPYEDYKEYIDDYHSASWLTGEEFIQAVEEVAKDDLYWVGIAALVKTLVDNPELDCRVVFWFDN